jgi:hypothetical protein
LNTPDELEAKLATVTSLSELEGFTKQLDFMGELHESARQMITTRRAEIMRASRR